MNVRSDLKKEWWPGCTIYEIYPRSFEDSNNDGIGDLKGIKSRLPYLKELGVDAVWIAPFFKSPMADYGYDISDYCDVDPVFGTLADFKDLLLEAHRLGLRVLIDLVLSHTSIEHPWFAASREGPSGPKSDWYVWADAKEDGLPNGWVSVFGGSAWTWCDQRQKYYLHHFFKEQPQLNLYNPDVRAALFDVVRFWLDLGVDGFRLDAVDFYMHDRRLISNPPVPGATMENKEFARQTHEYDMMLREPTLDFLRAFREVLNEFGDDRIAVGEVSSQTGAFARVGLYTGQYLLNAAYTLDLARGVITPDKILKAYDEMVEIKRESCMCWNFSNHDTHRTVSRHPTGSVANDKKQAEMFAMLRQFLPGVDCVYQGEELGLPDAHLMAHDRKDPVADGRDESRTPIPWRHDLPFGGFSEASPWLPMPAAHLALAVDVQEQQPGSLLQFSRAAFRLKHKHTALRDGAAVFKLTGNVLEITRRNAIDEITGWFNFGSVDGRTGDGYPIPAYEYKLSVKDE